MIQEDLINQLRVLISSSLEAQGFELIDLVRRIDGQRLILTILADKPQGNGLASASQSHKPQGGITLQECALLCRQLKNLIEEKSLIPLDYVLEVSSPGLDRPLKRQKDFARSINKEIVFFLNDLVDGKCQWQGVVSQVDETAVFIQINGGLLKIPLTKINKAQLVI